MNYKIFIGLLVMITSVTYGQIKTIVKYHTDLYRSTNFNEKIGFFSSSDTVEIKSYYPKTKVYLAQKDSLIGYIFWSNVENTFDLNLMRDGAEVAANKGQYWIGMTMSDATRLMGSPDSATKQEGSWGKTEMWYFKKDRLFLWFENGILTSHYKETK